MKPLLAIGEALIDMISTQSRCSIKDAAGFIPVVGGASANVCGAFAKLGGHTQMITQLGQDPFGDKILEEFEAYHIGTNYISRTSDANTGLAFVALSESGDRDFSFYRSPSADLLLSPSTIKEAWFDEIFVLHFCSVSLIDSPMKEAHRRAIQFALAKHSIISFDPNLRFPLWKDRVKCKEVVREFLPFAHILKIAEEELEFITGYTVFEDALDYLFVF